MIKPCGICNKTVKPDHQAIQYDSCECWVHTGCNDISLALHENNIRNNLDRMPFNNTELININNTNSMSFLESLIEIVTETTSFSDFSSNDIGKELPSKTSCKYYSVNEYQHLNKKMNPDIFHININGLGSKIDNLYEILSGTSSKMDILAITKTSEKEDIGFLSNVEMEGYEKYHTASKSAKGGQLFMCLRILTKLDSAISI